MKIYKIYFYLNVSIYLYTNIHRKWKIMVENQENMRFHKES